MVWNASSTSCSFLSTARQVARTIGPWRATRASKATSSFDAGIAGQELPVPEPADRPGAEEVAEVPEGRPECCAGHAIGSLGRNGIPLVSSNL